METQPWNASQRAYSGPGGGTAARAGAMASVITSAQASGRRASREGAAAILPPDPRPPGKRPPSAGRHPGICPFENTTGRRRVSRGAGCTLMRSLMLLTVLLPRAAGLALGSGRMAGSRLARGVSIGSARASKVANAAKKAGGADVKESVYSATVSLPKTGFDQRANAVVREPELQSFWAEQRVYERLRDENAGEPFTLHDGPPYANGDLHCGHALNKILKDFINRFQMMNGRKVRFVPGWDCHGLPIELKVLQGIKSSEERRSLTPLQLRERAAQFAVEAVGRQRTQFRRFGVWADWEAPYLTLDPAYEAAQVKRLLFGKYCCSARILQQY
ncbi:tRNA synthetases class I-domain-containing protein [Pavlovales sp. CCMP2436]|nr:tRNA synthetases class I-domain-containing protein [Pavlovales sp. CCMP2436]